MLFYIQIESKDFREKKISSITIFFIDKVMMWKFAFKSMERPSPWKTHSILKIHILGSHKNKSLHLISLSFRYPNQPVQAPPGQFHESPTEQFWNALPTDQTNATGAGNNMHSNSYPSNCNMNVNNNSNPTTVDYDGTMMEMGGGWL